MPKPAISVEVWRMGCSKVIQGQRVCEVSPKVKSLPCGCGPDERGQFWVFQDGGNWFCAMTPKHQKKHLLYEAPALQKIPA